MKTVDIVIPVYNFADTVGVLLESLNAQRLAPDLELRTVVVDDGSIDERATMALNAVPTGFALVRHERNRGRAAARNSGARAGQGEYLLFLDADCYLQDVNFVMRHIRAIDAGADVSAGIRAAEGNSFLTAFEASVNARRTSGPAWAALTSANFAIRRAAFENCRGFDERYRWYGFEDRDFAARLAAEGYGIALTPQAVVYHRDAPTAAALLRRMEEAGERSSGLFLRDHPGFYAQLHYSRFDFRIHPYRAKILYTLGLAIGPIVRTIAGRVVASDSSAFALKAFVLRAATGLAYLAGTRRAWISERRLRVQAR